MNCQQQSTINDGLSLEASPSKSTPNIVLIQADNAFICLQFDQAFSFDFKRPNNFIMHIQSYLQAANIKKAGQDKFQRIKQSQLLIKRMLDSDQVTFPSFAPSLSQSPRQMTQSHKHQINYFPSKKNQINFHLPSRHNHDLQNSQTQQTEQHLQEVVESYQNQNQKELENTDNQKQDQTSKVRIYCRLRPNFKTLYDYKYDTSMIDDGENCYSFDRIFGKFVSQEFLFNKIATRHIHDFMNGKNSTIFAYGQTGSGKTHTMFGDLKDQNEFGIIPRTLQQIFNRNASGDMISCSMLEIYNEKMMDLFIFPQHNASEPQQLKLKEINDQIMIDGLVEVEVEDESEILELVRLGHRNRKVASTYNNDASSRSHTILFVYRRFESKGIQQKCKLCFIDLAGSEKVRKSGVKGQTLEQAKKINLSLSCLGNVVHALTSNSQHIPYRNSKLTRILKDSLSGETNTSIITTCSADKIDYNETISTIKFAIRAKKIKNKKKLDNVEIPMEEIMKKIMKELDETKKQLNWYKMREELQKYNTVDIPEQDTCLMPLKTLVMNGLSASSRRQSDCSQSRSVCLTESSIVKRLH